MARPAEARTPVERDYHTDELPPLPQRDYLIPAERWIEAPPELRSLGADLGIALVAQPAVPRRTQHALARPVLEPDVDDEARFDPRRARQPRGRDERRRVALQFRDALLELRARAVVDPRPAPPRIAQRTSGSFVIADQQRAEPSGEPAFAAEPPAHDELLPAMDLHLAPRVRAGTRRVPRVQPLGDDAFEAELLRRVQHPRTATHRRGRRLPRRAVERELLQQRSAVAVREFERGVPVEPQHVEQHEDN